MQSSSLSIYSCFILLSCLTIGDQNSHVEGYEIDFLSENDKLLLYITKMKVEAQPLIRSLCSGSPGAEHSSSKGLN